MHPDKVHRLWDSYRSNPVKTAIHDADHMFISGGKGATEYNLVGESCAIVIASALLMAPTDAVWRVMDYGCGHGRCARHLRNLFPEAALTFADVDGEAARFCADTFGGIAFEAPRGAAQINLPGEMDLIWVGSVFTHLDRPAINALLARLWQSLRRNGLLIATFHGRRAKQVGSSTRFIEQEKWNRIVAAYDQNGFGFETYSGRAEYGVSLIGAAQVISMGSGLGGARLVSFSEQAWAGLQDVAAWSKG